MSQSKPEEKITPAPQQSAIQKYWNQYLTLLNEQPVATKAVTAGVLSFVSDMLAQYLKGRSLSEFDLTSLRNQTLIGFFVRGPLVHTWYIVLERIFKFIYDPKPVPQESWSTVLGKVFLDQTTFGPLFNLFYFYVIGFLEGRDLTSIHSNIGRDYVNVMMMNYRIWPLVNILNFRFVPQQLRVLFGNIVSIFWTTYVIKATQGK